MNSRTVFMFPGQGSQYAGMRKALGELSTRQKEIFAAADEILGFPLTAIMDKGPDGELTRTSNTQPALLAMGTAYAEAAERAGHRADIVMGHSLGEYAALVKAGVLGFGDGIRIVRKRGELMEKAASQTPGKMTAVIGAERPALEDIIARCREYGVIGIANYNSPVQVVISGESAAVDMATEMIGREKAGRAMPLNVSAPFHSPLMKPAAGEFGEFLAGFAFNEPSSEFIDNVTGLPERDPSKIREKLVLQLSRPVLWEGAVRKAHEIGAGVFIECGPGSVLAGLVKRIVSGVSIIVGEKLVSVP